MGEALDTLMELQADPYARARAFKERTGRPVVGFLCSLAPEELIRAAGALPVRITGEDRPIEKSGAHLQSYCCSLARTALDMALDGSLDFLDGTVFVHTCDTMMRLSDIWRLNAGFSFHLDTVLPVRYEGELAAGYMKEEVASFKERLEAAVGPVSEESLKESIETFNRNRELLAELYRMRSVDPGLLTCEQALWAVYSSALMDRAEHNELLEALLEELRSAPAGEIREKVPLFGIGSAMEQWEFLRMLEEAGGTLVDDDFCTGHRYFDLPAATDGDLVENVAMRLFHRFSCPCKHLAPGTRATDLTARVEESGARGALFFQFKFCEPHAFDYPGIKRALDEKGLPSLLLEIEQGSVSSGQLRTRVEALLETIGGKSS